jgi:hypothetical protein
MNERLQDRAVLAFAILVSREDSTRWGTTWVARSVLTGHVAEARTSDDAVVNLQRTVDSCLYLAGELGQSPREWYEAQVPAAPEHLTAFIRLGSHELEKRRIVLADRNCELEASIATTQAA